MLSPKRVFDHGGAVRRPPYRRLAAELRDLLLYRPAAPDPRSLPQGAGLRVLVIPALLTDDAATGSLRRFLDRCGFRTFAWTIGINWGPTPRILRSLRERLCAVAADGPVSVVGVSLGGVLARDLAYDHPHRISRVVTIASPIALPTASTLRPLVSLLMPFYSADADIARLSSPLPVPSTAIYTRDDGIVAWETCLGRDPNCTNVEVTGPHLPICRNPEVLRRIVEALLSPAGENARSELPGNGPIER